MRFVVLAALIGALAQPAQAQLASRPAEEWIPLLDSPARVAGLQVEALISRMGIKPGEVIADLGAGTGVFSIPLARAVGPAGKVYAVEIDRALLDHISRKVQQQNAPNVQPVLGKFADPNLPAADVDVAFMHDVLHHVQDRPAYLAQAVRYLKPGGRFVVIELDPAKGSHRDDATLQVTKDQLKRWMADLGLTPADEADLSPEKWFASYTKGAAPVR